MAAKRGNQFFDARRFASALGELVASLPSEASKRELDAHFDRVIQFLNSARERLAQVPTKEDMQGAQLSARIIEDLVSQAGQDPGLRAALGMSEPKQRKRPIAPNEQELGRAQEQIAILEVMPIDEMRRALEDESRYSMRDLVSLSRQMGIRTREHAGRDTMIHQIATRISNFRGYKGLGANRNDVNKPDRSAVGPANDETALS